MSEFKVETNIGDFPRRLMQLPREVRQQVLEEASEVAEKRALDLFRRIVRTWRRQPRFTVRSEVRPTLVRITGSPTIFENRTSLITFSRSFSLSAMAGNSRSCMSMMISSDSSPRINPAPPGAFLSILFLLHASSGS